MNDKNFIAYQKGKGESSEKFFWVFDEKNRAQTIQEVAKFAEHPDINFTWFDAVTVTKKIREVR